MVYGWSLSLVYRLLVGSNQYMGLVIAVRGEERTFSSSMTFEAVDWTFGDVVVNSGLFTPEELDGGGLEETGFNPPVAFPSAFARRLWNTSALMLARSGSGDSEMVDGIVLSVGISGIVPSGNVLAFDDT